MNSNNLQVMYLKKGVGFNAGFTGIIVANCVFDTKNVVKEVSTALTYINYGNLYNYLK